MRLITTLIFAFSLLDCIYPQTAIPDISPDSSGISLSVNFRPYPVNRLEKQYKILSNVNEDYSRVETAYSIQVHINSSGYADSSLLSSFRFAGSSFRGDYYQPGEKELFYGAWRNRLIKSASAADIRQTMIDGTNTMIRLGYSDLANDFMPFITGLMEEQQLYNYDPGRTRGFSKSSEGIVTSVEILNAMGSDPRIYAGVCRDVHETGRELLKSMLEVYYGHFYPGANIDPDDYLFLQSWTTNKSQHVTLSLINPFDEKVVYELDWGRVLEEKNIPGYENGRLFGNSFRVWQFDKEKNRSVPVDFRKTRFGKILDEDMLSQEEYSRLNGIYDEEFYSNIRLSQKAGRHGVINSSLGLYDPGQRYFLVSYINSPEKKRIGGFLYHSGIWGLQTATQEDTRKRELLYPQWDWQLSSGIMLIPRYISKFETRPFRLSDNLTMDAYFDDQLDIFFTVDAFITRQETGTDKRDFSCSGDANLAFSTGIDFKYEPPGRKILSSFSVQSRSTMMPKDVRLLSPNPLAMIPNLKLVGTGIDVTTINTIRINHANSLSLNGMLEFTGMPAVLYQYSAGFNSDINRNLSFSASFGGNGQMKGIHYYWYPEPLSWIKVKFSYLRNALSFSLLDIADEHSGVSVSYRKYIK
jgi:hypothetical protein